jgi:hypothetical protein
MQNEKMTRCALHGVRCEVKCNARCEVIYVVYNSFIQFTSHPHSLKSSEYRQATSSYFFIVNRKAIGKCKGERFYLLSCLSRIQLPHTLHHIFPYTSHFKHQNSSGTKKTATSHTPLADFGTLRHGQDAITTRNAALGSWLIWEILSESRAVKISGVSRELFFYRFSSVGSWGELKPVIRGISMPTFKAIAKLCITTKNSVLRYVSSCQVIKGIFKLIWGAFGSLSGEFSGLSGELSSVIWGAL